MLTNKKLVASCSVLTLTVLSLVAFSGCTPPGPRAVLDGARLLGEGHPDLAVPRLQEAVQLLPKNAQAWNYLGLAYHKIGRPADAARAYQQALLLNRNLSAARFNLGCLHLDQTNATGAIAELTTFTALQPNSAAGWAKLGTAQMRARQPDMAERSYSQALKLDAASVEALNGLGLIMAQRRRYAEALNYFNSALKVQSTYASALLNAAIVSQQNLNNRPAALQRYREYLALKPTPPNSGPVREMADRLELELRPPARPPASNASPAVVASPPRTETPALVAKLQPPPSTNKLSLPPQTPTNSTATTSNSVSRTDMTVTSSPPARVTQNTSVSPSQQPVVSIPPPKNVDVVQVPREEPIQPVRDFQPVLSNRTATAEADTAKTVSTLPSAVNLTAAKPATNALFAPAPKPKPSQGLIKKLNPVNWFRSKEGGEKAATRSPDGVASDAALPGSTKEQSPRQTAATVEPTSRAPAAFDGPRYAYHALTVPAAGDRPKAERRLAEGVSARERNRLKDAIDAFRKAVTEDPSFFEAYYNLGVAAFEAGQQAQALPAYEQALAIRPDSLKARYNFAVALEKANYRRDAANELESVITRNPAEPAPHLALASLYAGELGEADKARQHYVRFLELQPQSPQATAVRYWLEAHP